MGKQMQGKFASYIMDMGWMEAEFIGKDGQKM